MRDIQKSKRHGPRTSFSWASFDRSALPLLAGLLVVLTGFQENVVAANEHWVTTWGCAPQLTARGNLPPVPLAQHTLRQFVHTTIGGKGLRVRFSNIFGTNSVSIRSAQVALAAGNGSARDGAIQQASDQALTFRGLSGVDILPGEVVWSDPIAFNLPAITNIAVSIYLGNVSATTLTGHPGSRTTSFIMASNAVSSASLPGAATTQHWYLLTGVEVLAATTAKSIVVLGDSLADGRGSTTDGNNRWPDILAQRLATNAPTTGVAVVNMGIGGNGIYGGLGPAAVKRFERDVLDQNGGRYFILFEGVNDLGGDFKGTVATNLITSYTQFAIQAHARGLLAYGATITPFGGNRYYTTSHESSRQTVNAWLRTNTLFDGVIDFDAAVRDPLTLTNFQAAYFPGANANDWLHLNPAGYEALAAAIDLNLFVR